MIVFMRRNHSPVRNLNGGLPKLPYKLWHEQELPAPPPPRFYVDDVIASQWRHNNLDGVSNHQPQDCLLNHVFTRRSKKTSNSASLAFVWGIHRWPVNSPHKWPVTQKMFPSDDVIMDSHPNSLWGESAGSGGSLPLNTLLAMLYLSC